MGNRELFVHERSLATQISLRVISIVLLITLMAFSAINYFEYSTYKTIAEKKVTSIVDTAIPNFSSAVWQFDEESQNIIIKAILKEDEIKGVFYENPSTEEKEKFLSNDFESSEDYSALERKVMYQDNDAGNIKVFYELQSFWDFAGENNKSLLIIAILQMAFIFLGIHFFLDSRIIQRVKSLKSFFEVFNIKESETLSHLPAISKNDDEFDVLLKGIHNMSLSTFTLYNSSLEQERVNRDLEMAHALQNALLPTNKNIPGVQITSYYQSAEQTGGDWYSYYYDKKNHLFHFFCGDVTGHGISSALITGVIAGASLAIEHYRDISNMDNSDPKKHLEMVCETFNRTLFETGSKTGRIMTMGMFILNVQTGLLWYVNAGHTPPVIINKERSQAKFLMNRGSRLGFMPDSKYRAKSYHLSPGDKVCMYTDGILENRGPSGEMLPLNKMKEVLMSSDDIDTVMNTLLEESRKVLKSNSLEDDSSIVLIKWAGDKTGISLHDDSKAKQVG